MKIFKYPLVYQTEQWIALPDGAEILHVGVQNNELFLWALVDNNNGPVQRQFCILGTGFEFEPSNKIFLGTVFDRQFVWHVFEAVKKLPVTPIEDKTLHDMVCDLMERVEAMEKDEAILYRDLDKRLNELSLRSGCLDTQLESRISSLEQQCNLGTEIEMLQKQFKAVKARHARMNDGD